MIETIEITGVSTRNRGAELMLAAVALRLGDIPNLRLAVEPWFGDYSDRSRYGLWLRPFFRRFGRSEMAYRLMPGSFRRQLGLVAEEEVEAVIDASGFAFGDVHPLKRIVDFADRAERLRAEGKPLILLPQAFGPFRERETRKAFARLIESATLVYARDPVSREHVRDVVGDDRRVRSAPDFTGPVGALPASQTGTLNRVCLVPNRRMSEAAGAGVEAGDYLRLLVWVVDAAELAGLESVVVGFSEDDVELIERLGGELGRPLPVIDARDALRLKAELGRSRLVVGSRYHAIVSALAQGVPAIGTSWSHKYEALFEDYGCPDLLLPVPSSQAEVRAAVAAALGGDRPRLVEELRTRSATMAGRTAEMWEEVRGALGLGRVSKSPE